MVHSRLLTKSVVLYLAFLSPQFVAAGELPPLPQYDGVSHAGVVTCGGNTCHGATVPFEDSPIRQDEYTTWHDDDKHAKAYELLLNEQSQQIAKNLGLTEPAHEAAICLDCHSDNVPEDKRGRRFKLEDGVGCEACHGGAGKWLGPHVLGTTTHEENIALGLYPTEDPAARAKLCMSCHFGGESDGNRKFVTHEIMGAGHPRMKFELDSYTERYAHFDFDEDYQARKPNARAGTSLWVLGQLNWAALFLDAFLDPENHRAGLFPELVFFDCHACHHPMQPPRWTPRASTGLGPGVVRLNDSSLQMLEHIAGQVAPGEVGGLRESIRELHAATTESIEKAQTVAAAVRDRIRALADTAIARDYGVGDTRAIMSSIAARGASGDFSDYALAEQSALALSALYATLEASGDMDPGAKDSLWNAINAVFDQLPGGEKESQFAPTTFRSAMEAMTAALPR